MRDRALTSPFLPPTTYRLPPTVYRLPSTVYHLPPAACRLSPTTMKPHHTPENPFATRWTRPGALAYRFAGGDSAAALVERLRANNWWGEIIGPHGAGKSTLLATLLPALRDAGRTPLLQSLHDGQRRLPRELLTASPWTPATQVIVDGYEQLSRLSRARLKRRCRRAGCGLLVTAHGPVGLPRLVQVEPDLATVAEIVDDLQARTPGVISRAEVAERFAAHAGNIRDTLFDLYDLYEQRRRYG